MSNTGNKDKVAVLAIAYHNMGVEQEFLRSYPAAILSYKKAVNFAEKNLGPEDGITLNLRSVYENARNEVSLIQFWYCVVGYGIVQKRQKTNQGKEEATWPVQRQSADDGLVWGHDHAKKRKSKYGASWGR